MNYTFEELEKFVEGKDNLKVKAIIQPRWTDFNQWVIDELEFVLDDLNCNSYYTPVYDKEFYLKGIMDEINTLSEILLINNRLPYNITGKQIKERINKLLYVHFKIYTHGGM